MSEVYPGESLLSLMDDKSRRALESHLWDLVTQLQQENSVLLRNYGLWWKLYHAEPKQKTRTFPWLNASNVVIPVIATAVDAMTARSLTQLTAASPAFWSTRTENESDERVRTAREMARVLNWQADGNCFSIKHVLASALLEMYVVGQGVLAGSWIEEVKPVFFGRTSRGRGLRSQLVTFKKGPNIEHVPGEQVLWDRRLRIGEAPAVCRYREWSWAELRGMAQAEAAVAKQSGDRTTWDRDAIEMVKAAPGPDEFSEHQYVRDVKDEIAGLDREVPGLDMEPHGIWEMHVDWSLLGSQFEVPGQEEWGGRTLPLIAHLHRRTGKLLRLVASPYLLPYKPFVNLRWRHGTYGLARAGRPFQEIESTAFNQGFDSQTRSNTLWGKTREPRHNQEPLEPGKWLVVSDMGEIEPMNFGTSLQPNMLLLTAAQTTAERWMGHSDPLLGRDTRSGGHPAPATSTLALLSQTDVMAGATDIMMQEELSRLGEMVAILNQQFEENPGQWLQQVFGEEDASAVERFIFPDSPIPGNYFFTVRALSRTENPDVQMRRALQVFQAFQAYGSITVQGAQAMEMPQLGPKAKATWARFLDGGAALMSMFLEASSVDDAERYVVQLRDIGVDARNAFQQFAGEAQRAAQQQQQQAAQERGQVQGGAGAVSQLGLAGAGNGAGGGEGRALAGLGVLQ